MINLMHRLAGGRLLAAIAALALSIGGLFAFRSLPVDAFPDPSPSLVQVFTETEGLSPEEVERYVTYPIETAMSGLPKVDEIRSTSNFGLSVINIYFEDGTDVYFARQVVGERLGEAADAIPDGFGTPKMGPISTGLGIIMYYRLVDETGERSLVELREIADWMIKYPLQSVEGVTEVLSLGGFEKQYQVRLDPDQLTSYDLSVGEVIAALESANRTAGAQFIEIGAEQYTVRGVGLARSLDDLRETPVKTVDGRTVRVNDLGEVAIGGGVRQGLATANGEGETVAGLVLKLYGTNTSEVIENAQARFDEINQSLPDGVKAVPYYDQGTLVKKAAATVTTALWQGALLVAVIVFLFLGGWRPSLVVVMAIPFSVGFAFIAMKFLGIGANLMTLGGVAIAIGMMVDGAIVIAENVDRGLRERREGEDSRTTVARASAEVIAPLIAAVLVVIIVFLPLFSLQGTEGKTFRPLAASAALAMTGSLIYAALIAPAMALGLMRPPKSNSQESDSRLVSLIKPLAAFFVRRRLAAVGLAGVLLLVGGLSATRLGSEFTPALEEGDVLLRVTMAPSISLTEAKETSTRIETRLLEAFPEISSIVSRIGRGEVGAHADPVNSIEAFVALKPRSEWRNGISPDELRASISENLGGFPGVRVNVGQPIAMSVDELLTGTKAQLAVKIFGPDTEVLLEGSQDLQSILQEIPGATDVQADQITGAPQLVVSLNRPALGRYGLSVEEALDALRSGVGGAEAGAVFEGVRQFPVIVRYAEEDRNTPAAIGRIILESSSGARVPLESVANIREIVGPRQITRENGERFITVQLNVRGRDIGSYVADAQQSVASQLDLPAGYRVEWGGQFELQQEANARFAVVIPITLGIVFLILLLTFGRMKSAILILLNIPLALTGGAMALWIAGLPISVPATVGFIALFGIALGNGMVLVSFMDDFAREGRGRDELAVEAAGLRARPVLMTALTTALGLAPLLFASGVGAEVQRPLATVVMGGLVSSTVLTLLVLPALHRWFAPKPDAHHSLLEAEHVHPS
ncbi:MULTISPECIES: efflux RND transporter permease subunit [Hyphomonadaceae]|jgi:cobalt-zinc-cadmium resistance protein CzcA|uniref:CusA/CzcA family heavy metal efflux RND transporter n=8 Tax=Alphaproteobacteria TaxID=28211 RepID=A0A353YJ60_9PROT|nr:MULTISPECIES: CusA/CzcA family heavy metal efflux RND transporter [Hyphomonadaceae]HBH43047.1 CusA/CzcA family heavy metal efflux RND transporter [Hyphomonas atlantica]MBO6582155.1 efflux RND transporter permease subunit [Hyphomonas sp.]RIJ16503.1 efflux RND transporter permease subunit [Henriciella mobilis]RIJ20072.1 efflux RND transporter permease subunit [Henriciella mobilis]HBQ47787.1 CusA/CzcA family heavy metal efflux RND transporter [Hyphomonas atlantica]|tara:strand:- start:8360 stop:11473 length:3114 start_codon:yes stop_codon:yes gene_type:complete